MKDIFTRYVTYFIRSIFLIIMLFLLFKNASTTLYIFNGWYVNYEPTPIHYFIYSLLLFAIFYIGRYFLKFNSRFFDILIVVVFAISFIVRLLLVYSFEITPAGDSWAMVEAIINLIHGYSDGFKVGGYISNFPHQLGGVSFWLPIISIFKFDFTKLFIVNVILVQGAMIFFVLFVKRAVSSKAALLTAVLLSLFIPNYFYQFLIYNESVGLLLLSIILYVNSKDNIENWSKIILLLIFSAFGVVVRKNILVLLIGILIVIVIYEKYSKRNLIKSIGLIIVVLFSSNMLIGTYDYFLGTDIRNNSIPENVTFAVGLSGPGYTPKYTNYYAETKNNRAKLQELINEDIQRVFKYLCVNVFEI